jgi:D-alanyl-D-alanine carboxypeptidase (penicillin-binding protein 5/6)
VRRLALVAGAAAAAMTACGGGVLQHRTHAPRIGQISNGPVAPAPGPLPLAVKLADPRDPVVVDFHRPPRSGLLFDLETGRVLWRRNPERVLPMASLTKMMTAVLVVASTRPRDRVYIPRGRYYQGSAVGILPHGKRVQAETLLYGLLLPSGNDAARALARHVAGSVGAFVTRMNQRAAQLGMRCTHFTTPDGYLDAGNQTCAVDLAAMARAVLDEPRLAKIVATRNAVEPLPIKGGRVWLYNNNPLLRLGYPGTIGVKTGYTDAAGHCLVAAARRRGHTLGVVLLHSPDTGTQARKLLDRGFAALSR